MKTTRLAWLALLLPLIATAAPREDYARQWPLLLGRDDGGAYRVELDAQVYRTAIGPALKDLDVINAQGQPVPADVFAPEAPLTRSARRVPVAWFALPAQAGKARGDLAVFAERDADGRILSVQARAGDAQATAEGEGRVLLFDLSRVRERVEAMEIQWNAERPIRAAFRVETSDDLQDWRTAQTRLELLDLAQGGQRLRHNDVPLVQPARYLRLTPLDDAPALPVTGAQARLPPLRAQPALAHESLAARKVEAQGRDYYEFDLLGHFPVAAVDIEGQGNAAVEWMVESRDREDAAWQRRAGPWFAWRVAGNGAASVSQPQALADAPVRDRYWRLHATRGVPVEAPTLRLLYRPEVVVFLAQGEGPYTLVAGSAKAARAAAPMPQLVDALRRAQGEDWRPAPAYLGQPRTLAGAAALAPQATPVNWTGWLLWALLLGGAGLVAAMAFSLLRRPKVD